MRNKKVIGYSLFRGGKGKEYDYTSALFKNIEIAKKVFPDWEIRVMVGKHTVTKDVKEKLRKLVKIYEFDDSNIWHGLVARLYIADDPDIEYFISRDADSPLTDREKVCVDEWIKSGKNFLVLRDHPAHSIRILDGMFGMKGGAFKISEELKKWIEEHGFQRALGQKFLSSDKIWNMIKEDMLQYDIMKRKFGDYLEYPKHMPIDPVEHIGQTVNLDYFDKHLRYYND